jgi:hypothetical protein
VLVILISCDLSILFLEGERDASQMEENSNNLDMSSTPIDLHSYDIII